MLKFFFLFIAFSYAVDKPRHISLRNTLLHFAYERQFFNHTF